jgi:hypothetical protein
MDYQPTKLTEQQINQLKPGDKVNVEGEIVTIVRLDTEFVYYTDLNGVRAKWFRCVLLRGTLDLEAVFCAYCGKPMKRENSKQATIWRNYRQETMTFCKDNSCAGNYQMGREG